MLVVVQGGWCAWEAGSCSGGIDFVGGGCGGVAGAVEGVVAAVKVVTRVSAGGIPMMVMKEVKMANRRSIKAEAFVLTAMAASSADFLQVGETFAE
jgi:hypothetical protein